MDALSSMSESNSGSASPNKEEDYLNITEESKKEPNDDLL